MNTGPLDPIEEIIGVRLEDMKPYQLVRYIRNYQKEMNGVVLSKNDHGDQAAMKLFQADYGNNRAASILRHLFLEEGGKALIFKEVEFLTPKTFAKGLRWWTDKIDLALQSRSEDEKSVESEFIFATEL